LLHGVLLCLQNAFTQPKKTISTTCENKIGNFLYTTMFVLTGICEVILDIHI